MGDRRREPVEVQNIRALRVAGKALVVVAFDPKNPDAPAKKADEVMIPISEIGLKSDVRKPGDRGTLVIPVWLAVDRDLVDEEDPGRGGS